MSTSYRLLFRSFRFIFEGCLVAISIIPVLLLRLLRPFLLVRFGYLRSQRLGHFAANTELYLCERKELGTKSIDIFCLEAQPVCNTKLLQLWKSSAALRVWPRAIVIALARANKLLPIYRLPSVPQNLQEDRDINGLLEKYPPHISLSNDDIREAKLKLEEMGIPSNSKHICLTVRDGQYLKKYLPSVDYSCHDYRDANIDNYIDACEYLAEKGFYVFRMGVHVDRPLVSSHPRVIDYACMDVRSELLDIYLASTCEFCITQGTGFDALPVIFRRPLLQVNAAPIGYSFTYLKDSLFIPKHIQDNNSGQRLSLGQVIDRGLFYSLDSSDYSSRAVCTVENTREEILEAVTEMLSYYCSNTKDIKSIDQYRFERIFFSINESRYGNPINKEMKTRICASFLMRNKYYIQDCKD